MTEQDRAELTKRALKKELTIEDVYYITLNAIQPYVEVIQAKVQTYITDTEFVIKTTEGVNLTGGRIKPWVYIGKVELDAIRVYQYLDGDATQREVSEYNI